MKHCFYHDDLDGHCAGAIVKIKYPECQMHSIDYNYTLASVMLHLNPGDEVYVVDFSFVPSDLKQILDMCDVHWIDHHVSAIEALKDFKDTPGLRQLDKAGCELTWMYLHENEPTPIAVFYVGRWDVWDHRNSSTIPFHRGMSIMTTDPATPAAIDGWKDVFKNDRTGENKDWNVIDQILNIGLISESMKAQYDKAIAKYAYYIPNWEGKRTVALNAKVLDSYCIFEYDEVFEAFDPEVLVWYYQLPNKRWLYQLRNYPGTNTEVSVIAESFGGGGHAGAAGFTADVLLLQPTGLENKWMLFCTAQLVKKL